MKLLQNLPQKYVCSSCSKSDNSFDFKTGPKRLENAKKQKTLDPAGKLERILVRDTPVSCPRSKELPINFGRLSIDPVAEEILHDFEIGKCPSLCSN